MCSVVGPTSPNPTAVAMVEVQKVLRYVYPYGRLFRFMLRLGQGRMEAGLFILDTL